MAQVLDLSDRTKRFAISFGVQPVTATRIKHADEGTGASLRRLFKQALGEGPWEEMLAGYLSGFKLDAADVSFHNGTASDAADSLFPGEEAHPWTAHLSGRSRAGMDESQLQEFFGVFKTLRTGNYNGAGVQLQADGTPVGGGDLRNYYFYGSNGANPARVIANLILRWGQRLPVIINWPKWVDWRDWNDETIPWDDSKYTPRGLSLTATTGGTLAAGNYYARVATMKSADESGASVESVENPAIKITLSGANNAFQVAWLLKDGVTDQTAFRVYVGTTPSVTGGYFLVSNPASRNLLITTLSGTTAGAPRETCTTGILRQIKRFEANLFFIPPFDLSMAVRRVMEVSCAERQWSNGKLIFMGPQDRAPVFTVDMSQSKDFKVRPVDRRTIPNEIQVNYRDADDEFLNNADPVILTREALVASDGQTKTYTIDIGTAYRSLAQRVASFLARSICDLDQMADFTGSPKTYHVLPGDRIEITRSDIATYAATRFKVVRKEEHVETQLGDSMLCHIFPDGVYSDTDHSPIVPPLRPPTITPFTAPKQAVSVALSSFYTIQADGSVELGIHVGVQFAVFVNRQNKQRGRVFIKKVSEDWEDAIDAGTIEPSPSTLQGSIDIKGLEKTSYNVRVVPESDFTSAGLVGATVPVPDPIVVTGKTTGPTAPAELRVVIDSADSPSNPWIQLSWDEIPDTDRDVYLLYEVVGGAEVLKWTGKTTTFRRHPLKGETTINFRLYSRDTSGNKSATYAANSGTVTPPAAPATLDVYFEPFRFVYKCAAVARAVVYQWSRVADFSVYNWTTGPQFIDTSTADIARSGTIYVRAVDKWSNEGAIKPKAYTIPLLAAPSTLTIRYEPMRLVYRCTAVTDARRYEWSRSGMFTDSDITTGPTFTETDLTIPRSGTIYVRAIDKWDDPGAVKSTAYNIPPLAAPAAHTVTFDGKRLTHTCTPVTNAKKYQWADDIGFTTNLVTTTAPLYVEAELAGQPRTATVYVRALDAWDDPGASRAGTYSVPQPPRPRITIHSRGVSSTVYDIFSSESAAKTKTYLQTVLEQAADVGFTVRYSKKTPTGYVTRIEMSNIPGLKKARLRGKFVDAFGDGLVGATYV